VPLYINTVAQNLDPHVFVIESRSAEDHFEDRMEGRGLCEQLRTSCVPHAYLDVVDIEHLEKALDQVSCSDASYVHFSCHGEPGGFKLTDNTFVSWKEFHDLAWTACDQALAGKVLVFSACLVGEDVGVLLDWHSTFCSQIVAPTRRISWDEGLAAYSTFYFRATNAETSIGQDVELMNDIVGDDAFIQFQGYRAEAYAI